MKRVGAYLAIFGLAALILPFLGYQLRLLGWLDDMGTTGMIIKIAMIAIGAVLFFRAAAAPAQAEESVEETKLD